MEGQFFNETRTSPEIVSTGDERADYIRDWCLNTYRFSRDKHEQDNCEDWFSYYKYWKNWVEQQIDPDDYHSNVGVGLAWPTIKVLSAKMMAPWQAGDRLMEATAYEASGTNRAPLISAAINDKFCNKIPRLFSKLELCKEASLALGRGIMKPVVRTLPGQKILKRTIATMLNAVIPGGVSMGSQLSWQDVPSRQRFSMEYVDPFNWWYVGGGELAHNNYQQWDCTFERSYMTSSQVWRNMQSGYWEPFNFNESQAKGYDQYMLRRLQLDSQQKDNVRSGARQPKMHQLIECQGWVEVGRSGPSLAPVYEPRLVQILDEHWLVKNEPLATWNGQPGYIVFEPFPDFAGDRPVGLIEGVEQLLLSVNDLVNIGLDNGRKALELPLLIDPDALEGQQDIKIGPTEQNFIRNPSLSVRPLEIGELGPTFDKLLSLFLDLIRQNTGVSELDHGAQTSQSQGYAPGLKTARGFQQLQNLAANRFSPVLTKMDRELYRPMAEWTHETMKQYMTDEEPIRLPGLGIPNMSSAFTTLRPSDLDVALNFSFNTRALDQAQGRRRQEFIEMVGLLTELAQSGQLMAQGAYLDAFEVARMLMHEFDREAETDKIIRRVNAMPPMVGAGGPFPTPGQPNTMPGGPITPTPEPGPGGELAPAA